MCVDPSPRAVALCAAPSPPPPPTPTPHRRSCCRRRATRGGSTCTTSCVRPGPSSRGVGDGGWGMGCRWRAAAEGLCRGRAALLEHRWVQTRTDSLARLAASRKPASQPPPTYAHAFCDWRAAGLRTAGVWTNDLAHPATYQPPNHHPHTLRPLRCPLLPSSAEISGR